MINTVILDSNSDSLNYISSLIKKMDEVEFKGGFDSLEYLRNLDLSTVDVIIFDIKMQNTDETLNVISNIKSENPKINFIALSNETNSLLIHKLEENGIKEFLLKPPIDVVLEASIKKFSSQFEVFKKNNKAKTMTVFSSKNAVGKTTTIINLAYNVMEKENKKVCILDLNQNSADAADFLGIKNKHDFGYIAELIENYDKKKLLEKISSYKNTNLYVFSLFSEKINAANFSKENIVKVLNGFKNIFDYIFVDLSSNIDEKNLLILNNVDFIILIGLFSLKNADNLRQDHELFKRIGYNELKMKLLLNRTVQNSCDTMEEIENILNKKADYQIPNNYLTAADAVKRTSLIEETNPQSNIARAYRQIADDILKVDFDEIAKTNNTDDIGMFDLLKRTGE